MICPYNGFKDCDWKNCAVSDDDEGAKMVECHYFPAYSICDILEWLNEESVEGG